MESIEVRIFMYFYSHALKSGQTFIKFNHQVARRTEGFRKLYCGAISASTTEKMLQVNIVDENMIQKLTFCVLDLLLRIW